MNVERCTALSPPQVAFSYRKNPKLLAQLQQCEKTGTPLAIVIGESELQAGEVKLRRVDTREERSVPRGEMVTAIRAALAEADAK